jgi:hypothetical protein
MHKDNARAFERIQCGNSYPVQFSLIDPKNRQQTSYCICTDLSCCGAHFFTDREFQERQQLELVISSDKQILETVNVTVVRADSSLYDEERFCAALKFHQSLACFEQLAEISNQASQSIAA